MKKLFLSTAALAVFPMMAFASPASSSFNWTGPYVGVSAGGGSLNTDTKANTGPYFTGPSKLSGKGGGVLGGLTAGYNYQLPNNFVGGVEADYSYASIGNSGGADSGNIIGQGSNLDSFGTVRARLGYAVGRDLFFATGGLAYGDVKSHAVDGLVTDVDAYNRVSKTQTGWTAGAGMEHAMTDNITLKFEALYADLGSENSVDNDGYRVSFNNTVAIARAGINYKF